MSGIRPGQFDVTGRRSNGTANIEVNGVLLTSGDYQPSGTGLYFRKEVANTPAPWQATDLHEPVQVAQNAVPLTPDQGAVQQVGTPSSPTPFTISYDADGNLLADGRWSYTWDGEPERRGDRLTNLLKILSQNRLIKMEAVEWIQPVGGYLGGEYPEGHPAGIHLRWPVPAHFQEDHAVCRGHG